MKDCLLVNNTGRDDHNDRYVGGNFVLLSTGTHSGAYTSEH